MERERERDVVIRGTARISFATERWMTGVFAARVTLLLCVFPTIFDRYIYLFI